MADATDSSVTAVQDAVGADSAPDNGTVTAPAGYFVIGDGPVQGPKQ